jgi:hypothetical protein
LPYTSPPIGLPLPKAGSGHSFAKKLCVLTIGTPVVQFTAFVSLLNVELGEIADTSDLNVIRSLDKVDTLKGTVRDETRAATRLGAPSNFLLLRNADSRIRVSLIMSSELQLQMLPERNSRGAQRQKSSAELSTVRRGKHG